MSENSDSQGQSDKPSKLQGPALDMALVSYVSKHQHKSAVIRRKLRSKILTAVTLIVVRGAKISLQQSGLPGNGQQDKPKLAFAETGRIGVLQGDPSLFLSPFMC